VVCNSVRILIGICQQHLPRASHARYFKYHITLVFWNTQIFEDKLFWSPVRGAMECNYHPETFYESSNWVDTSFITFIASDKQLNHTTKDYGTYCFKSMILLHYWSNSISIPRIIICETQYQWSHCRSSRIHEPFQWGWA
jgi:hypothetical protein